MFKTLIAGTAATAALAAPAFAAPLTVTVNGVQDRAAPLYPRHQHISAAENSAITALLHSFQLTLL